MNLPLYHAAFCIQDRCLNHRWSTSSLLGENTTNSDLIGNSQSFFIFNSRFITEIRVNSVSDKRNGYCMPRFKTEFTYHVLYNQVLKSVYQLVNRRCLPGTFTEATGSALHINFFFWAFIPSSYFEFHVHLSIHYKMDLLMSQPLWARKLPLKGTSFNIQRNMHKLMCAWWCIHMIAKHSNIYEFDGWILVHPSALLAVCTKMRFPRISVFCIKGLHILDTFLSKMFVNKILWVWLFITLHLRQAIKDSMGCFFIIPLAPSSPLYNLHMLDTG